MACSLAWSVTSRSDAGGGRHVSAGKAVMHPGKYPTPTGRLQRNLQAPPLSAITLIGLVEIAKRTRHRPVTRRRLRHLPPDGIPGVPPDRRRTKRPTTQQPRPVSPCRADLEAWIVGDQRTLQLLRRPPLPERSKTKRLSVSVHGDGSNESGQMPLSISTLPTKRPGRAWTDTSGTGTRRRREST